MTHQRSPKDSPWCWASQEALQRAAKLGMPAFNTYVALIQCESMAAIEQKGQFPASLDELSMLGAVCRETVKKGLKLLADAKLIAITTGTNSRGVKVRNRYRLLPTKSKAVTQPSKDATQPTTEDATQPTNKEKETISPPALKGRGGEIVGKKERSAGVGAPCLLAPLEGGSAGAQPQGDKAHGVDGAKPVADWRYSTEWTLQFLKKHSSMVDP